MASCVLLACNPGSGVDRNKRLNELSSDEARSICETTAEQFRGVIQEQESVEYRCTITGLFAGETPELCVEQRDSCIEREMADPTPDESSDFSCAAPAEIPETCDATVGQLEDCYDVWMDEIASRATLYDCANAGDEAVRDSLLDFAPPAACEPFVSRCANPELEGTGG